MVLLSACAPGLPPTGTPSCTHSDGPETLYGYPIRTPSHGKRVPFWRILPLSALIESMPSMSAWDLLERISAKRHIQQIQSTERCSLPVNERSLAALSSTWESTREFSAKARERLCGQPQLRGRLNGKQDSMKSAMLFRARGLRTTFESPKLAARVYSFHIRRSSENQLLAGDRYFSIVLVSRSAKPYAYTGQYRPMSRRHSTFEVAPRPLVRPR